MTLIARLPRNEHVLQRLGSYPRALNVLDRRETAVQRMVGRSGLAGFEPPTQATLLALVEVAGGPVVFLDIGAHIGLYSSLVATIFPDLDLDVRAFEPTPTTAELTRQLAAANGASVQVEEVALSSSAGTASLYLSAKAETSNSFIAGFRESAGVVEVEMTTIDDYCRERDLAPTVIKIDVELLEAEVLLGGLETFRRHRPAIVCELLRPRDDTERLDQVMGRLADLGYVLHRWADDEWTPTAAGDYLDHVRQGEDHRDWLLTPGPLPRDASMAVQRWRAAIARCTSQTNLELPNDGPLPADWDKPYVKRSRAARTRRLARRTKRRMRRIVRRLPRPRRRPPL